MKDQAAMSRLVEAQKKLEDALAALESAAVARSSSSGGDGAAGDVVGAVGQKSLVARASLWSILSVASDTLAVVTSLVRHNFRPRRSTRQLRAINS